MIAADWDHGARLACGPFVVPESGIVMGKELVVADVAESVAEETEDTLEAESYIDVEVVEESDAPELTLDEANAAELEAGIASVFDSLLAEAAEADDNEAGDETDTDLTFTLLAELNRLWAQAA